MVSGDTTRLRIDRAAPAAELGAATETEKVLCDAECMARVNSLPETVTPSGLKFKDIAVGKGPTPPTGYQASLMQPQGLPAQPAWHAAPRRRRPGLVWPESACCCGNRGGHTARVYVLPRHLYLSKLEYLEGSTGRHERLQG